MRDNEVVGRGAGGSTATVARDESGAPAAAASSSSSSSSSAPQTSAAGARRAAAHDSLLTQVRASDIEPYTGLRYLSKLFRLMAVILVLLLLAEVVTGVVTQGSAAIPVLLPEASKLIVAAALLWASGDLAILLIDVGHDVRAARILLGRQVAHNIASQPPAPPDGAEQVAPTRAAPGPVD